MKTALSFLLTFFVLQNVGLAQENNQNCDTILFKEGIKLAYPRLSADQQSILYQSNESGHWQLQIYDRVNQTTAFVADDSLNNYFPDWSPDNRYIAFTSDRNGNENIYLFDTETQKLQVITNNNARNIHPYFSPDGRYILYNSTVGNGSLDVYLYDRTTKTTKRVTKSMENETCARFSPDMKQLVYLKNSEKGDDIFLYTFKNNTEQNLSQTPHIRDGWPVFSFDGTSVFYSSMETGSFCIVQTDLNGKKIKQVTQADEETEHARFYPGSDNSSFIYTIGLGETIAIAGGTL